jgi:hypothetical protein
MDKPKHGGVRKGSGAKPQYNEKTTTFGVRCPISKTHDLKKIIHEFLENCKK